MKNAIILHGTGNNPQSNWFEWLKKELENLGYQVLIPNLPNNKHPNSRRYNEFIFSNKDVHINDRTILIGHSSGAVAILGLLQNMPKTVKIRAAFLVGSFKDDLGEKDLSGLFEEPFDFDWIKSRAEKFVFIHSDNDPWCPLEGAEFLCDRTGGEMTVIPGQKHFSISTMGEKYKEFPELLELIKKNT